jgi:hypothetical protein
MASARTGFIALAAGFLALPINSVGASSYTDAYCDLAEDLHDHIQDTFLLLKTGSTDDDELELAEATTREYILEMVEVAPIEARRNLRNFAQMGMVGASEFQLGSAEASVQEECGFSLFEVDLPNGRSFNLATFTLDVRLGIDQIKPAIEAVRTVVGADVLICSVETRAPGVSVVALDGSTNRTFLYQDGVLFDRLSAGLGGCAAADDVLAFDVDIFHDFLDEHPNAPRFGINSYTGERVLDNGESITYTGEPVYFALVPASDADGLVEFQLDPQTGETASTLPLG